MDNETRVAFWPVAAVMALCLIAFNVGLALRDPGKIDGRTPAAPSSCPPPPCREQMLTIGDTDTQHVECPSERHTLGLTTFENRVYAFCRCSPSPASEGMPARDLPPIVVPMRP